MINLRLSNAVLAISGAVSAQTFDWSSIEPSTNLSWVGCYSGFECARLSVPLNYSNPSQGDAAIAMTRIPSKLKGSSEYLGPLFFNPGGPGGSGVDTVVGQGSTFASLGPQFDLVGFDPRGVGHSTPPVNFFSSDAEQALWLSSNIDANSSSDSIPRLVARGKVLGQLARDRDNGILAHVATDNVARDMLQIVEAYGEQKLQYWGISYGSVLGATFATLFPDRVGRMIIDGVVETDAWFSTNLTTQVTDTDKVMQGFFDGCHAAGPSKCAFYASSPDAIAAKLNALYDSIRAQPLPAYSGPNAAYGLVDYDTLIQTVVGALYEPYEQFSTLASALASLSTGNATGIYQLSGPSPNSLLCPANSTDSGTTTTNGFESSIAIECADGGIVNDTATMLEEFMLASSSTFAGIPTTLRAHCIGWQIHPQRFAGPAGANTSYPIMLIGNTADPITPLASAHKMSLAFPGSVVLTQNSFGHTSFAATSTCTQTAAFTYLVNGTLPEPGTVCQVENELFP